MVRTTRKLCERAGPVHGPKSGKEGFGVKKLPFLNAPEKGDLSQKIPISLQGSTRKKGIFRLKLPFSGALGNGSFLTPKPSFPDFGDFDPCTGPVRSQRKLLMAMLIINCAEVMCGLRHAIECVVWRSPAFFLPPF